MTLWESFGQIAAYVIGFFILGYFNAVLVWWLFQRQLNRMELAGVMPPILTLLGTWLVGIVLGLFLLGRMFA